MKETVFDLIRLCRKSPLVEDYFGFAQVLRTPFGIIKFGTMSSVLVPLNVILTHLSALKFVR